MKIIRENPELVRESLRKRGSNAPLDELIAADERRRELLVQVETLKAERNRVSKEIPRIKDSGERERTISRMRGVSNEISTLDRELSEVEKRAQDLLLHIPNVLDPEVPVGKDESENVVLEQHGEARDLGFPAKPHWELGERLGIINFEQGQRISGSRFYVMHRDGARLERAVINWLLDLHREQGYGEVYAPYVVREQTLWNSANLPDFEDTMYHDFEDDVWLIPTSEVTLTGLHAGEILSADDLPLLYTSYSPNWRREKFSAGKDVRGIKRGHQFNKVEMYHFTLPEDSAEALERLVQHAEEACRLLGLAYRRLDLCSGDIGFKARRAYDVEVWSPGVGEWLEVSSCSNVGDFQARRAGIRFKREAGARTEFVHTLNGTGLGMPRTMIAIMENYQQPDGSIAIPEVIRPYMCGQERIGPNQ